MLGAGISNRELAAAASATDKSGKQRVAVLGRSMMLTCWHIVAHHLTDRLCSLPAYVTFVRIRDQCQPFLARFALDAVSCGG